MSKETAGIIRLAIGVPAYGGNITAHQARMWVELGNTLSASLERFQLVNFDYFDVNGIDQARNLILTRAFQSQADWVLMIDADTWVEPNKLDRMGGVDAGFQLLRMLSEADRAGADIVVAPVRARRVPVGQSVEWHDDVMAYVTESGHHVVMPSSGTRSFVEIDEAATAVFATRLAFVAQHELSFRFTGAVSEDKQFCRDVKAAGGKILVDGRVRTAHLSRTTPLYSAPDE